MHRLALLLAISACTTTSFIDPEEVVTIERGVYGLTVSGCDTSGCEDNPYEHAVVTATPAGTTGPEVTTTSDDDGFFQLTLAAGTYELCVHSCITVTVVDAERVRRDFISGPGGGIWCDDDSCRPR